MNRIELSAQPAAQLSLDKTSADRMVAAVFAAVGDSLAKGEPVSIAGFGTSTTKGRPARQGRKRQRRYRSDLALVSLGQ